jgi:4-nitrophenyl phosphatase
VVTAQYVAETFPGGSVYYIGQDGVQKALLDHGLALSDEDRADAVVVGLDPHLTYEKLRRAAGLIRAGARFVGCNPDVTLPHGGDLLPGNGATLAFLEAGTGIQPVIIGKPEPAMFEAALESMNVSREETATLGDRLETDILGGRNAGLRCILVLSGVTDAGLLQASSIQPDWVFENVAGLVKTWKTLLE